MDLRLKLVNHVWSVPSIADFAKNRARNMMINHAEKLGVSRQKKN